MKQYFHWIDTPIPRGCNPFGQRQILRPLAGPDFLSMHRGLVLYFWSRPNISVLAADQKRQQHEGFFACNGDVSFFKNCCVASAEVKITCVATH